MLTNNLIEQVVTKCLGCKESIDVLVNLIEDCGIVIEQLEPGAKHTKVDGEFLNETFLKVKLVTNKSD